MRYGARLVLDCKHKRHIIVFDMAPMSALVWRCIASTFSVALLKQPAGSQTVNGKSLWRAQQAGPPEEATKAPGHPGCCDPSEGVYVWACSAAQSCKEVTVAQHCRRQVTGARIRLRTCDIWTQSAMGVLVLSLML